MSQVSLEAYRDGGGQHQQFKKNYGGDEEEVFHIFITEASPGFFVIRGRFHEKILPLQKTSAHDITDKIDGEQNMLLYN